MWFIGWILHDNGVEMVGVVGERIESLFNVVDYCEFKSKFWFCSAL